MSNEEIINVESPDENPYQGSVDITGPVDESEDLPVTPQNDSKKEEIKDKNMSNKQEETRKPDTGSAPVVQPNSGEEIHTPSDKDFSHTNKPEVLGKTAVSAKSGRSAEEISQAVIEKYYKNFTNNSNLDLDDILVMTIWFKDGLNGSASVQTPLGEKLAELIQGTLVSIKFRNDERAKSVISIIVNSDSIGSAKNITARQKHKAIEGILLHHPAIDPTNKNK